MTCSDFACPVMSMQTTGIAAMEVFKQCDQSATGKARLHFWQVQQKDMAGAQQHDIVNLPLGRLLIQGVAWEIVHNSTWLRSTLPIRNTSSVQK